MCERGNDKEPVRGILLHCGRFFEARFELNDAVEDIYADVKSNCSGLDKVTFMIVPPCNSNISIPRT